MRNVYKAALAAAMMLAVMALGASSASALTITNEDESPTQGIACGAVSLSGHTVVQGAHDCNIHAESLEIIDLEIFGITVSRCNNEFDARIGSNGTGYLYNQVLAGADCDSVPCTETAGGAQLPWQIVSLTEGNDNQYTMRVTFCVETLGQDPTNCTLNIPVAVSSHSEANFGTAGQEYTCAENVFTQVHGSWMTEDDGDDDIEIRH